MQSIRVAIGLYNIMPQGARGELMEHAYQNAWRPFLSSLYKFPSIKAMLHFSGNVLSWIEHGHPEYLYLLVEMVKKGQVELLGGGFYAPLASVIPQSDLTGQIESLSAYLRKTIGKRPLGAWLYECNWVPSIPGILRNSKLQYTFLPASTFMDMPSKGDPLEPFIAEDHRKNILVFPVFGTSLEARHAQPFEATLADLMARYPASRLFCILEDGNAFADSWQLSDCESPDIFFERSFAYLQKNCLEYELTTMAALYQSLRTSHGSRTLYLSQCMTERYRQFSSGLLGIQAQTAPLVNLARQAAITHPLARNLYNRMQYVSAMANLFRGDKSRKKNSLDDIWKAQSGELYWQSLTGGILLPEARLGAYRSLIEAERTIRPSHLPPSLSADDFDCDGRKEVLFASMMYNCFINPSAAAVFELDSFRSSMNYCSACNVETGSTHAFVDDIRKPGGFSDILASRRDDWVPIDSQRHAFTAQFQKEFMIPTEQGSVHLGCRKSFGFDKTFFHIDYELHNKSSEPCTIRFCTSVQLMAGASPREHILLSRKGHDEVCLPMERELEGEASALIFGNRSISERLALVSDRPFAYRIVELAANDSLPKPSILSPDGELAHGLYTGHEMLLGWDCMLQPDGIEFLSLSVHFEH
ncbi:MAG: alpha-amylase/4-alpha-glucanotransferase domain-containing protein [Rectinemataceae bacterium]|nr:DUF1925 domain-containing protein [Spirochaetaceae bacterium]